MSSVIIELNVGGCEYATTHQNLTKERSSKLAQLFSDLNLVAKDSKGRYFIDRDGPLFRYVLDYLRHGTLVLPEHFTEMARLRREAAYYELTGLITLLEELGCVRVTKQMAPAAITIGYRGTFAFGRDGLADVKFRKLSRILVSGRASMCREVFGDTLNDSRDPDTGAEDRYSSRFFLKHCVLEQAFDMLFSTGFEMAGTCGSGTNSSGMEIKPGQDSEENKWQHYNEFIFVRRI